MQNDTDNLNFLYSASKEDYVKITEHAKGFLHLNIEQNTPPLS